MNQILQNPELLKALIPVLTPLLIVGVRAFLPKVPSKYYPLLAALVGVALDLVAHFAVGTTLSPLAGFALGLAGVGLREVKDQLGKPQIPPTVG
jgi:hypothetical protein